MKKIRKVSFLVFAPFTITWISIAGRSSIHRFSSAPRQWRLLWPTGCTLKVKVVLPRAGWQGSESKVLIIEDQHAIFPPPCANSELATPKTGSDVCMEEQRRLSLKSEWTRSLRNWSHKQIPVGIGWPRWRQTIKENSGSVPQINPYMER